VVSVEKNDVSSMLAIFTSLVAEAAV